MPAESSAAVAGLNDDDLLQEVAQQTPALQAQYTENLRHVNEYIQAPFWLLSKIFFFLFFYVWARGTLPRFRYDQLMNIGWKLLLPVSIANVIITAGFVLFRSAP